MIGALRSRLVFERKTQIDDGAGGFDESWETAFAVWGAMEAAGGGEPVVGDRTVAQTSYRIRIRFRTDAAADQRIRVDGKVLAITWLGDPDGRRYWLDLGCAEGSPS